MASGSADGRGSTVAVDLTGVIERCSWALRRPAVAGFSYPDRARLLLNGLVENAQ